MPNNHLYDQDIVSIKDFAKEDLEFIFNSTDKISNLKPNEKSDLARGRTLGYIFYEPSTRTRMSFEAAMASLGGSSIGIFDPRASSVEKGESLADTQTLLFYDIHLTVQAGLQASYRRIQ
jgi:aspartate carbamoyltransferase catalytic subunit